MSPRSTLAVILALLFTACSPQASMPERPEEPVGTESPAYALTIQQLNDLNGKASDLLRRGDSTQAAALVKDGQPLARELLRARKPTLAAMQAVSDHDHLYGTLLLGNRHYIWARQFFQTNVTRWKNWQPATEDTVRRLGEAKAAVARCDQLLKEEAEAQQRR